MDICSDLFSHKWAYRKSDFPLEVVRELVHDRNLYYLPEELTAEEHSARLDNVLGFKIRQVEQALLSQYRAFYDSTKRAKGKPKFEGSQAWIGLHPQTLQTPFSEIIEFSNFISERKINTAVDFGAAYGRVGIVMNAIFSDLKFIGYEIIDYRAKEGNRIYAELGLDNCFIRTQNILDTDFKVPKADLYFIYDFSDPADLKKLLNKLVDKIYKDRFFIVARGVGVRSLIQLKYPQLWAAHGAIHGEKWSLYSSFCDL
jgi:hypothetical protein